MNYILCGVPFCCQANGAGMFQGSVASIVILELCMVCVSQTAESVVRYFVHYTVTGGVETVCRDQQCWKQEQKVHYKEDHPDSTSSCTGEGLIHLRPDLEKDQRCQETSHEHDPDER